MWSTRRVALALLVVSVVVHTCLLIAVRMRTGGIDGYAFDSLDCTEFYAIARNVAEHGVFSGSPEPPLEPDTWRTPGYPLFLAALMLPFGYSPAMLIIAQQVLCVLNVLLLFGIVTPWMSERGAAVVAVLFLFEPYHLYYSLWLMSTTMFVTVLLLIWLIWQTAMRRRRMGWFTLLGFLTGFLVLVRPVAGLIPIALLVGVVAAVLRFRREQRDKLRTARVSLAIPIFAVSCFVVVGTWMMRNQVVAGHFALSDQGGVVLAYFKATEVVLWREGRTAERYLETTLDPTKADLPHRVWERVDARLRGMFPSLPEDQRSGLGWRNLAQGNRTAADSFTVSAALSEIGWSHLAESPLCTATCYLVRFGSILSFPLNLALAPPLGVEVDRFESAIKGGVYLLLALFVLVRIGRRGFTYGQVYFPLACTMALLLATAPQIDPRFRVPMIPLLLAVALLPKHGTSSTPVSK